MLPLRHIHKKKFASKKYKNTFLDHIIYLFAFAGPIMTLPQVYDIWIKRDADINLVTWGSYLFIGIVWTMYGLAHKEKPIIYSNALGCVINVLVIWGTILLK